MIWAVLAFVAAVFSTVVVILSLIAVFDSIRDEIEDRRSDR